MAFPTWGVIRVTGCGAPIYAKALCDKPRGAVQNLFKTMVYHTDRAGRFALISPLLLPERVPVVIRLGCLTRRHAAGFFMCERFCIDRRSLCRVLFRTLALGFRD